MLELLLFLGFGFIRQIWLIGRIKGLFLYFFKFDFLDGVLSELGEFGLALIETLPDAVVILKKLLLHFDTMRTFNAFSPVSIYQDAASELIAAFGRERQRSCEQAVWPAIAEHHVWSMPARGGRCCQQLGRFDGLHLKSLFLLL